MSGELPRPGPRARALAKEIRQHLRALRALGRPPDETEVDHVCAQLDRFHALLFEEAGCRPRCTRGCASCCSQQVFDVHAFEVERIGRLLRAQGRADAVFEALQARLARFDATRRVHPRHPEESEDDWIERVAIEFWKHDDACTLLGEDGSCSIHVVRPWSCRRHFSLGDPAFCRGETAHSPRHGAFIADPFEEIDALLAGLDRFACFDPDTDRLDLALARWLGWRSR